MKTPKSKQESKPKEKEPVVSDLDEDWSVDEGSDGSLSDSGSEQSDFTEDKEDLPTSDDAVSLEDEDDVGQGSQSESEEDSHEKLRGSIPKQKNLELGNREKPNEDFERLKERRSKSDSHGHKRKHGHREKIEVSKKKIKIFDPRAPGETNEKDIKVGEKESWFHGSNPIQVFSGFHLLNDAGEYVARTKEEVVNRAYQHLGQFTSDFVHLVSGFDVDERKRAADAENRLTDVRALYEKKCTELENLKAILDRKEEELLKIRNTKASAENSLVELHKEMKVVKKARDEADQGRDEAIQARDEAKDELAKVSSVLDSVKADLSVTSSTLSRTQHTLEVERSEKDKLYEQISELKKTSLLAGEEGYKECWGRFVKDGCDGVAHTWEKYLEDLDGEDEGGDNAEKSPEGKGAPTVSWNQDEKHK